MPKVPPTNKKLTGAQIDELAAQLSHPYGSVKLLCDGRIVTLEVRLWSELTYRVMTFVDGSWTYAWGFPQPDGTFAPEAKFGRKVTRFLFTQKERAARAKFIGKRAAMTDSICTKTLTHFDSSWTSGRAALRHLNKVCFSVEVLADERAAVAKDNLELANDPAF